MKRLAAVFTNIGKGNTIYLSLNKWLKINSSFRLPGSLLKILILDSCENTKAQMSEKSPKRYQTLSKLTGD